VIRLEQRPEYLLAEKSLPEYMRPLHGLQNLKVLEGSFYPDSEFLELRKEIPKLECSWFDISDEYGRSKVCLKIDSPLSPAGAVAKHK
jgi:hypothetical protein